MEIEIQKERLLHAVSLAEKVSGKDVTHPILNNIFLSADGTTLIIRSTNLDLGVEFKIPARVSKKGTAVVSGKTLLSLVTNMYKGVNATLRLENQNVIVSDDGGSSLLKALPSDEFPTIPNVKGVKEVEVERKVLLNGIQSVWHSASASTIKPELSSVYMYPDGNNLCFVATDSFRLAEKKIPVKGSGELEPVLVPFRNVPEIVRVLESVDEEGVAVYLRKNQLSLVFGNVYLTSRLIDGTFPDYRQIIPKEMSTEAVVLKQDLIQALKKTGIFLDKFGQVSMRIHPKKKTFSLHSSNADVGETSEMVDAALSGEELDIGFNQRYITDCFQSIQSDSVSLQFVGLSKPMIIRGVSDNSFLYLVMPMNK